MEDKNRQERRDLGAEKEKRDNMRDYKNIEQMRSLANQIREVAGTLNALLEEANDYGVIFRCTASIEMTDGEALLYHPIRIELYTKLFL